MKNRNTDIAVTRTTKEILNNTLIYIPVILFLIYAGNTYYGIEILKGLSLMIPTVGAVLLTTILTKNINHIKNTFNNLFVATFIMGASINIVMQSLLIVLSFFNIQFNIIAIFVSIILSGLGSAFFTIYDYHNVYQKEYRNIFVTLIFIFTTMLVVFLKLPFDITLSFGLLIGVIASFIIFNYKKYKTTPYAWSSVKSIIKKTIALNNIKHTPKHYIQTLPVISIPYVVLLSKGFVNAGILTLCIIIASFVFIAWSSIQRNLLLTKAGYPNYNTKKFQKGLILIISITLLITIILTVFSQQIISIFMIPVEYGNYFSVLALSLLPAVLALIIMVLFNDIKLLKNQNIETTLLIFVTIGTLILSKYPQLQLGVSIFMLYSLFSAWVLIKTSKS